MQMKVSMWSTCV